MDVMMMIEMQLLRLLPLSNVYKHCTLCITALYISFPFRPQVDSGKPLEMYLSYLKSVDLNLSKYQNAVTSLVLPNSDMYRLLFGRGVSPNRSLIRSRNATR